MLPTNLDEKTFERLVGDGLEHLWDYAYLGNHPLAQLASVNQRITEKKRRSHLDTGRAVSEVLQSAIEDLRPSERQLAYSTEKHFYPILRQAYIDGRANRTIADSMNIGERTLYRHLSKAIGVVAQVLREWEA